MDRKVRVGFIGVGFMGQIAHLKNYVEIPDCEVVAISEVRAELGKKVAQKYNVPHVYTDFKEMLAKENLDAVVCAQHFGIYYDLVPQILEANVNLFTEKPMCINIESGKKLAKIAKDKGLKYCIGYHKRSDPAIEYAKDIIAKWNESGEFGKMRYIRVTMPSGDWERSLAHEIVKSNDPYPELNVEVPQGLSKEHGEDYISFINFYIHQVNAMRYLFGEDYKLTFADKAGLILTTESENGMTGVIEMSPYLSIKDWDEKYFIGYEKGFIEIDLPAPLVQRTAGKVKVVKENGKESEVVMPILPNVHAMKHQAENFIAAVKGEKEVKCTPDEAVKDLELAFDYIKMLRNVK